MLQAWCALAMQNLSTRPNLELKTGRKQLLVNLPVDTALTLTNLKNFARIKNSRFIFRSCSSVVQNVLKGKCIKLNKLLLTSFSNKLECSSLESKILDEHTSLY